MTFIEKLKQAWANQNSLLCVGLDPALDRIPAHLRDGDRPLFSFNKAIIDATAEFACAFKPQIAYYAGAGAEAELERTIAYIHEAHPDLPVILDAKRGDIGATAEQYAREAFDRYKADAVTVNPYMGGDTLQPFLTRADKGTIILCRTSNPGAADIQNFESDGKKLYQHVAEMAATGWNANQNVLLVVGATYPSELGEVRAIVGDMPLLVPGIGAQGGDIEQCMSNG
ncbi:MAG TPA: orotidine-5'-phosphate decarboxylase, partial [Gammaproteobacteria bacterium]|nr:orotidine-5'-phosphate decarboxylase [Gammaproteobacteria bacterium]